MREILKRFKPILEERFKVKKIGIFSSYGRGEESEENGVGILVEFCESVRWVLFDFKEFLEEILGKQVHLVTAKALKPKRRDKILEVVVFA